jgi:tape measure domain-containing protein
VEKLQWVFELLDRMSGPLGKIDKSLGRVDGAFKKVQTTQGRDPVTGRFLPKARLLEQQAGSLQSAMSKVSGGLAQGGAALAETASVLAGPALAVGAAAGGLAALGTKWMVSSLSFRENTLDSLEAMLKSKSAAEDVFKKATTFAAKTPFATGQVAAAFEKLIAAGIKPDDLEKMMGGIGDLAGGSAEKVDRALMAVSQIKGKGKLQGEELMQLAEMGLPMGAVFENLGKSMHKTSDEVQKLMSAGKISADVGIGAIMSTIDQTFGGRMEKAGNSLSGLWSTLASAPEDILFRLGPQMEPMIGSIKDFVKQAIELMGPDAPGGQMLGAVFKNVGTFVGDAVRSLASFDFSGWLQKVSDLATSMSPKIEAIWTGFSKLFGSKDILESISNIFADVKARIDAMDPAALEKLGEVIGGVTLAVLKLFEWSIRLAIFFGTLVDLAMSFWSDLFDGALFDPNGKLMEVLSTGWESIKEFFRQAGIDTVQGFIDGIMLMLNPVGAAATLIGQTAAGSLKDNLDQHSPSRVFAEIGHYTGLGFLEGLAESGMNDVFSNPIQPHQMVAADVAAGGGAAAGTAGAPASGAQTVTINIGDIIVSGEAAKDAPSIGKEVGGHVQAAMTSFLRGVATQAGK